MAAKFKRAKDAQEISVGLIAEYHKHLIDLNVRVEFAFVNETIKKGGKERLGECRKVGGHAAYLASGGSDRFDDPQDSFFLITLWWQGWQNLTPDQKIALIDHELCHAYAYEDGETGEVKLKILPHDIEEFNSIVSRHGCWLDDLQMFIFAAREQMQSSMNFENAA